ncbi:AP-1 complex subunit mu [Gracilariopsis chorda]|uniref:AP-1 complex subunit mu n=1 Tax=Gracilariopsis chorda TaxID=448386 RepID=A0A2V3ISU3_9FLOR|nr:AP-1 complex subunit mu [Gracilariopsis chorda]|eukprot:PXF45188.1 AP-1 complex subunit mu [Gracilariopsis chorda]
MINSIHILNSASEVLIEKHYRGKIPRTDLATPLPLLSTTKGAQINLHINGLTLVATTLKDTNPLVISQFLTSLAEILVDYFGEINEHAIKDNFVTVYELLDEMLDNGFPATLESNMLKELISPPSMLNRVFEQLGAETPVPVNAPSLFTWRRGNVSYAQNEIFVDVVETIDATFEASHRRLSHLLVTGVVQINSRLSGTPDVSMTIRSQTPFDDVCFHHSVRRERYLQSNVLTFVPPDGVFKVMAYTIRDVRGVTLPVEVGSRFDFDPSAGSGSVSVSLMPRFPIASRSSRQPSLMLAQVMSAAGGKPTSDSDTIMADVSVKIPFGEGVTGASLSANYGTVQFDSSTGTCKWNIGSVTRGKTPSLVGNISVISEIRNPQVVVSFRIPGFSASGVGVDSLEIAGERYKYYKGLKCVTKSGCYEFRT